MKVSLLGYKPLNFVSNDGKNVQGTKLFVSFSSAGVTGAESSAFFVKSEMTLPKLVVGNAYVADFSNTGKLIGLYEG